MRLVYLDEAGISASELIVLVAAIIVDADRQWRKLVARLSEIAKEHAVGPDILFTPRTSFTAERHFRRIVGHSPNGWKS
jgi:hypothetical protein